VTAAPPAPAPPNVLAPAPNVTRILFCGTYPIGQTNGYSRVVYHIAKHIGAYADIRLTIYGFQNFKQTAESLRNDIPPSVVLHDALATENPRRHGFGELEIADYIRAHPQDVVVIFNDSVITASLVKDIVEKLTPAERRAFKLVSYKDLVYPYDKRAYIDMLNAHFDAVVAFTPYWREVARQLGLRPDMPCYVFPHGFDHDHYFPIPANLARMYYGVPPDAFVILNLNRNQPRKRWDHTIMVLADVVQRHIEYGRTLAKAGKPPPRPIKLMVATQMDGFWNLLEIFDHQLRLRGLSTEVGKDYIMTLNRPQAMTDEEINILYNACDVGINTCEGEGFGLCQFEHAAVGAPQVVPNIGGFKEYLHPQNAILAEPKFFSYVDKSRDQVGGYAESADPKDMADGVWKYYMNPALVKKHGRRAREEILQHYRWETVCGHFYKVLNDVVATSAATAMVDGGATAGASKMATPSTA